MTGLPPWAQQLVEDNRPYLNIARRRGQTIALVITQQAAAMGRMRPNGEGIRTAEFGIAATDMAVRLRVIVEPGWLLEWTEVEPEVWDETTQQAQFNIKPNPRQTRTDDLNAYAEKLAAQYRAGWFDPGKMPTTISYRMPGPTAWPPDDPGTKLRFVPTLPTQKQAAQEPPKPPESLTKTPNGRCIRLNLDKE